MGRRFVFLDFVRTIAISLIVLAHIFQVIKSPFGGFFGIDHFYWVSLGGIGVTLFLVLSGMALEINYGKKKLRYFSFMTRRIFAIYPVYYISILIAIFLAYLNYGYFHYRTLYLSDLFYTLTGFYAFAGKWGGHFVDTSWIIGLIISLYFLYPLISRTMKKYPHITLIFLLVISILSRLILGNWAILPNRPLDWFPLCRVFEFGLGIYVINQTKGKFLEFWKNSGMLASILRFTSEVSLPLFLISSIFLYLISYLSGFMSVYSAIVIYLIVSIVVSWGVHIITRPIRVYFKK
jgi:peptidoglycan/LPS O-acetylase OafA/YrhL